MTDFYRRGIMSVVDTSTRPYACFNFSAIHSCDLLSLPESSNWLIITVKWDRFSVLYITVISFKVFVPTKEILP